MKVPLDWESVTSIVLLLVLTHCELRNSTSWISSQYEGLKLLMHPVSTLIMVWVQFFCISQQQWLILSGLTGWMNKYQFDFQYRTQLRLYSNQKTLQDISKTALIKKRERKKILRKKYNHWKHVTISSLCVVDTKRSCDSPSTSYVHKPKWITWPTSGPGSPADNMEEGFNSVIFLTN